MRIHPNKIPNGIQPGEYPGKSDDGSPRNLVISEQPGGMVKVSEKLPDSPAGRFVIVSSKGLANAWKYTLDWFNGGRR